MAQSDVEPLRAILIMLQLFSLSQGDTQYVGKLSRYFNQVLCDFGPHQTIQVFTFLSPFPPSIKVILAPPRVTRLSRGRWCVHRSAPFKVHSCLATRRRVARSTDRFEPFSLLSYHIVV